jgi:hypothetical protein
VPYQRQVQAWRQKGSMIWLMDASIYHVSGRMFAAPRFLRG